MSRKAIRRWQIVHRWSSLISTAFLLMLCLTGLPLIFHDEIEQSLQAPLASALASPPPLSHLIGRAVSDHPSMAAQELYFHPDRRLVDVEIGAAGGEEHVRTTFDMFTGNVMPEPPGSPILDVLYTLHVEMFAGLAGSLFLGFMGLLLLAAIVSGVALYGPFTRKLPFGVVRPARRARWLDLHNLLGIVTTAWLTLVGLTGAINTLSGPVARHWQETDLAAMAEPFMHGRPPAHLTPVSDIIAAAERAAPGMWVTGVYYPGRPFATPQHYGVYLRGATPLTARLLTPMLIDAESGRIDAIGAMPLHVNALLISQPLHFGDYGGLPLKLLWAALDLVSIVVLLSGLWLFAQRHAAQKSAGSSLPQQAQSGGRREPLSAWRQWSAPALIAASSTAALIIALLCPPGPWRWLAWFLLALPLALALWAPRRRRELRDADPRL